MSPGDRVWIPDLKAEGTVTKQPESPKSVVIQTSTPVSPQNEGCESCESTPIRERNRAVPSALGASQEDYEELLVPEDQPAVNEPVQPEPLQTRLRDRGALRGPERLMEQC